jgi:hypothetical protein
MNIKPSLLRPVVAVLTLTAIAVTDCLADTTSLGRSSLSTLSAPSLKTTTPLRSSVRSFRFVGKVGGVAFDAVAQPEPGLTVKSLGLNYDPAEPDGGRLKVIINSKPVVADIYDWELIPIARYAASNSTSCFTLFGELEDKEKAKELRLKGDRILNYDEAFKDTLLGFRLFQLDVLVLHEEFGADLPKVNGQYLLGAGEHAPDLSKARDLMREYFASREGLQRRAESDEDGFPTNFQSYVICDQNVDLRFGVVDSQLALTGAPFYYFWKEERTDQTAMLNRAMLEAARKAGLIGPKDTVAKLEAKHKAAKERSDAVFLNALNKALEAVKQQFQSGALDDRRRVTYLDNFSREHLVLAAKLAEANPAVWRAGEKTMRYSAFFRYCKKGFPAAWKKFTGQLQKADPPVPSVTTPTVMTLPSR